MSEESLNKNEYDSQQEIGDATDNSETIADEMGDTVKPWPKGMANKGNDTELVNKDDFESNGK